MSESLPDLNSTTGVLLIATWANSFLYMAEIIQARYYFKHFKHDDWKRSRYLADQHWPILLLIFTTAAISVLVQSFLVVRYWWLRLSSLAHRVVTTVCRTQFGGAFACGVIVTKFPAFKEREKVRIPAMIWLVTEAVADLSIAAALLWELKKARPTLVHTRSVLDRLVALTIRTGTATATLAVATVIAFLLKEETTIPTGIVYTLGRVYVLSMLANLNIRRSGRSASMASGGVSSAVDLAPLTSPLH
ncbi:hypothetical protein DFH09DRAFT_1229037 [Mycena vulgaris]|nr:hypothetical protein DFH09DRAFT_1229037 [Mycena vulgaris]